MPKNIMKSAKDSNENHELLSLRRGIYSGGMRSSLLVQGIRKSLLSLRALLSGEAIPNKVFVIAKVILFEEQIPCCSYKEFPA